MRSEQTNYWLNDAGLSWVRDNCPGAQIARHARMVIEVGREILNGVSISFPRGGLTKARRAGHKPKEASVETICGVCGRSYVPFYEDDPCIAALPGIKYACCGHGKERGYLFFENGITVRFDNALDIERHTGSGADPAPNEAAFWRAA